MRIFKVVKMTVMMMILVKITMIIRKMRKMVNGNLISAQHGVKTRAGENLSRGRIQLRGLNLGFLH